MTLSEFYVKLKIFNVLTGVGAPLQFLGLWNASTNTPTLTSGVGTQGGVYVVSVSGTTNLDGNNVWNAGDWAVFNGTVWERLQNAQSVFSPIDLTAHAGGGQASGTPVTNSYSRFTTVASPGDSATLVVPPNPEQFTVVNAAGNSMSFYPPVGMNFAGYGINAPIIINPFGSVSVAYISALDVIDIN